MTQSSTTTCSSEAYRFDQPWFGGHATCNRFVVLLAAITVFVFDMLIPLGVAASVPYLIAVLLSVKIRHGRAVYITASVCSVLVLLGWVLSP